MLKSITKTRFSSKDKLSILSSLLKVANPQEADDVSALSKATKDPDMKIAIFDFDSTLFRSPLKTTFFKGSWWASEKSLSPPIVPEKPDPTWWIKETFDAAKEAIADPDTLSVCLTGRQDRIYKNRIPYLLIDAGLNFDILKLSDSDDTESFKSGVITELIRRYPKVSVIDIWDDKPHLLERYKALVVRLDPTIDVTTHHVIARSKVPLYEEPPPELPEKFPSKSQYIGLFLDSESKAILEESFPTHLDDHQGDHVTTLVRPTEQDLEGIRDILGTTYDILITGYVEDEFCQAVTVSVSGVDEPNDKRFHITIAVADGTPPKYANELIAKGNVIPQNGPMLKGILWWK